ACYSLSLRDALPISLVIDDRLDLVLGQECAEVRHPTRGDPADPVLVPTRHAERDPVVLARHAGLTGELAVRVAAGQVRAVCAAPLRGKGREVDSRRVVVRPALGVAA